MSAIERDKELAAKATQGEWQSIDTEEGHEILMGSAVYNSTGHAPMSYQSHHLLRYEHGINPADGTYAEIQYSEAEANADHIVRLHNRASKYDALVNAVRAEHDGSCNHDYCTHRKMYETP